MPFLVKLAGLALNCNVLSVTATHCDDIYPNIKSCRIREVNFPIWPLVPTPGLSDVPLFDVRGGLNRDDLKPLAIGLQWIHLGRLLDCRFDGCVPVVMIHGVSPWSVVQNHLA